MKKIAYVTKELSINGISEVIFNYCQFLDKDNYDITVFSGPPIERKYIEIAEKQKIKIIETPPKRKPLEYYFFLFKKLKKNKYDIVHVHGSSATITIELMIAKIKKIKKIIAHSHNTKCDNIKIHNKLKKIIGNYYDDAIACSDEAGRWMFGKRKFTVIKNGIDFTKYSFNENAREKIRKEYNMTDKIVLRKCWKI